MPGGEPGEKLCRADHVDLGGGKLDGEGRLSSRAQRSLIARRVWVDAAASGCRAGLLVVVALGFFLYGSM